MPAPELRARTVVQLDDVRVAAGLLLAAAALVPVLPGPTGLPCPLRSLTGVPCPLCGMTTSVVATVHLRFGDAVSATPAGVAAVMVAVAVLAARRRRAVALPWWSPAAVLALLWAYQLWRVALA